MKKKKNMESSIDELLERPENHQVLENGDVLYGYNGQSDTWKELIQETWLDKKSALGMFWAMKNPFDEHRTVMMAAVHALRPHLYALAFPFRYYGEILIGLFSREKRSYAISSFEHSTLSDLLIELAFIGVLLGILALALWGLKAMGIIA